MSQTELREPALLEWVSSLPIPACFGIKHLEDLLVPLSVTSSLSEYDDEDIISPTSHLEQYPQLVLLEGSPLYDVIVYSHKAITAQLVDASSDERTLGPRKLLSSALRSSCDAGENQGGAGSGYMSVLRRLHQLDWLHDFVRRADDIEEESQSISSFSPSVVKDALEEWRANLLSSPQRRDLLPWTVRSFPPKQLTAHLQSAAEGVTTSVSAVLQFLYSLTKWVENNSGKLFAEPQRLITEEKSLDLGASQAMLPPSAGRQTAPPSRPPPSKPVAKSPASSRSKTPVSVNEFQVSPFSPPAPRTGRSSYVDMYRASLGNSQDVLSLLSMDATPRALPPTTPKVLHDRNRTSVARPSAPPLGSHTPVSSVSTPGSTRSTNSYVAMYEAMTTPKNSDVGVRKHHKSAAFQEFSVTKQSLGTNATPNPSSSRAFRFDGPHTATSARPAPRTSTSSRRRTVGISDVQSMVESRHSPPSRVRNRYSESTDAIDPYSTGAHFRRTTEYAAGDRSHRSLRHATASASSIESVERVGGGETSPLVRNAIRTSLRRSSLGKHGGSASKTHDSIGSPIDLAPRQASGGRSPLKHIKNSFSVISTSSERLGELATEYRSGSRHTHVRAVSALETVDAPRVTSEAVEHPTQQPLSQPERFVPPKTQSSGEVSTGKAVPVAEVPAAESPETKQAQNAPDLTKLRSCLRWMLYVMTGDDISGRCHLKSCQQPCLGCSNEWSLYRQISWVFAHPLVFSELLARVLRSQMPVRGVHVPGVIVSGAKSLDVRALFFSGQGGISASGGHRLRKGHARHSLRACYRFLTEHGDTRLPVWSASEHAMLSLHDGIDDDSPALFNQHCLDVWAQLVELWKLYGRGRKIVSKKSGKTRRRGARVPVKPVSPKAQPESSPPKQEVPQEAVAQATKLRRKRRPTDAKRKPKSTARPETPVNQREDDRHETVSEDAPEDEVYAGEAVLPPEPVRPSTPVHVITFATRVEDTVAKDAESSALVGSGGGSYEALLGGRGRMVDADEVVAPVTRSRVRPRKPWVRIAAPSGKLAVLSTSKKDAERRAAQRFVTALHAGSTVMSESVQAFFRAQALESCVGWHATDNSSRVLNDFPIPNSTLRLFGGDVRVLVVDRALKLFQRFFVHFNQHLVQQYIWQSGSSGVEEEQKQRMLEMGNRFIELVTPTAPTIPLVSKSIFDLDTSPSPNAHLLHDPFRNGAVVGYVYSCTARYLKFLSTLALCDMECQHAPVPCSSCQQFSGLRTMNLWKAQALTPQLSLPCSGVRDLVANNLAVLQAVRQLTVLLRRMFDACCVCQSMRDNSGSQIMVGPQPNCSGRLRINITLLEHITARLQLNSSRNLPKVARLLACSGTMLDVCALMCYLLGIAGVMTLCGPLREQLVGKFQSQRNDSTIQTQGSVEDEKSDEDASEQEVDSVAAIERQHLVPDEEKSELVSPSIRRRGPAKCWGASRGLCDDMRWARQMAGSEELCCGKSPADLQHWLKEGSWLIRLVLRVYGCESDVGVKKSNYNRALQTVFGQSPGNARGPQRSVLENDTRLRGLLKKCKEVLNEPGTTSQKQSGDAYVLGVLRAQRHWDRALAVVQHVHSEFTQPPTLATREETQQLSEFFHPSAVCVPGGATGPLTDNFSSMLRNLAISELEGSDESRELLAPTPDVSVPSLTQPEQQFAELPPRYFSENMFFALVSFYEGNLDVVQQLIAGMRDYATLQ